MTFFVQASRAALVPGSKAHALGAWKGMGKRMRSQGSPPPYILTYSPRKVCFSSVSETQIQALTI